MFAATMTIASYIAQLAALLTPAHGEAEALAIARLAAEYVSGIDTYALRMHGPQQLNMQQIQVANKVMERLAAGMPVQYATSRAWFAFDFFEVSPAVLIPRPETEELVRLAARHAATLAHPSILDVGTGSGCIAITLKKMVPHARVSAVDLSAEALAVARGNAVRMGTDIHWQQLNFLDTHPWSNLPAYDLIVSNPPYIPPAEASDLEPHVTQWEPGIALFTTNPDPLQFYKALAAFGHGHLQPGGWLLVEVHQQYAHDVCSYFEQQGYTATLHFDVFDNPRMVAASLHGTMSG